MPTSVPSQPGNAELARLHVGAPVSGGHGARWANELAFLSAYNVPPIASLDLGVHAAGVTASIYLAYARTPGVQFLLLDAGLWDANVGSLATLTATLSGASFPSTEFAGGLDGTRALSTPTALMRDPGDPFRGLLDVSGCPDDGTIQDLRLAYAESGGTSCRGVHELHAVEIPLAQIDPVGAPTTQPGLDGAWPNRDNPLYDGSTTTPRGFKRLVAQLDAARYKVRPHWQVCFVESILPLLCAYTDATSYGAFTWFPALGSNPKWTLRPPAFYGTASTDYHRRTFRVRYRTANNGGSVKIRPVFNGVAASNISVAGTTTWTAATVSVDLPVNGSGQEVLVQFQGQTDATAGRLYASQFALIGADQ